jgi:hypothetical protein
MHRLGPVHRKRFGCFVEREFHDELRELGDTLHVSDYAGAVRRVQR